MIFVLMVKIQFDKNSIIIFPVLSKRLSQEKYSVFQIENQPFELKCTVTGTKDDIDNSKITWTRPDKSSHDVSVPPEGTAMQISL